MDIAAVHEPDSGSVLLDGQDIFKSVAAKRKISYLPQRTCFFPEMTCLELLLFIGDAKGVDREKLYRKIDEVVEIAGIEDEAERLVGRLDTTGIKRLGLAASVIGNPDIILFDGLFDGIPANKTGEFKTLVKMFGGIKPILLGMTYASDVIEICDGVIDLADKNFVRASDFPSSSAFAERFGAFCPEDTQHQEQTDGAQGKLKSKEMLIKAQI